MRCVSCDELLKEHELKRRLVSTNEFLDMCDICYETIEEDVPTISTDGGGWVMEASDE